MKIDNQLISKIKDKIYSANDITISEINNIVSKNFFNIDDFCKLISINAEKHLEHLAQLSHSITIKRFGKTIKLYMPVYMSNLCSNSCLYCGFNIQKKIERTFLNMKQLENEFKYIHKQNIDNILLVSGDDKKNINLNYLVNAIKLAKKYFSYAAIEIHSLKLEEYIELEKIGLDGVTLYQETYIPEQYKKYHLSGSKANYQKRLNTFDNMGKANIKDINLGVLLGLSDWRIDAALMFLHGQYLLKKYWKSRISFSFPRIKKITGGFIPEVNVKDKNLVHLITIFRIFFNDANLLLSTREPEFLRNNLIPLGITQMSADSKTNPGGYQTKKDSNKQFDISDKRHVNEISEQIIKTGYEPVFKDWDINLI